MSDSVSIPILPRARTAALVGNPNTGKSTVFNVLTGHRQRVGNYPGVTVERRAGLLRGDGDTPPIEMVDLPGAYSLAARGVDEALVLDVLLGRQDRAPKPELIVVVVDAANLGRNLFFTTQILELGRPVVVALNMTDVAEASGVRIDADALSRELGVAVVPVVATKQSGIDSLKRAIIDSLTDPPAPLAKGGLGGCRRADFPGCVRAELDGLTEALERFPFPRRECGATRRRRRWRHRRGHRGHFCGKMENSLPEGGSGSECRPSRAELMQTLLGPGGYHEQRLVKQFGPTLAEELAKRRDRIQASGESLVEVEARVRYAWINRVVGRVVTCVQPGRRSRFEAVDRVLTHRFLGLVILLLMMALCFQVVYTWARPLMDAIDGAFNGLGNLLAQVVPAGALQSLMVNGLVAGVGAVLVFLPQILLLFLFIAILEDCGYMARAAFLLDRWMGSVGLSGKSFIPLLSSFACAVPGIMATRTVEDRRDRLVTMLIAPLMSCSARLPVYTLMIGLFIPATPLVGGLIGLQAVTLLGLYLVGVTVAIPVALILKRTILRGEAQPLLMELPTYKWPSARTVLYRVYGQGKVFCVSAGTIIFAVTIVVWALGYYPHPASIAADGEARRMAARQAHTRQLEQIAEDYDPSLTAETVALKMSEANQALESRLSDIDRGESGTYLRRSILGRLGRWIEPVVKPIGWDWRIGTAIIASFPAREVVVAGMGTIYNLGDERNESSAGLRERLRKARWPDGRPVYNIAVALSIMVFFALCCQCGGTLAAMKRETNSWRWPLLTFTYMTALAYLGALATYQITMRFV